MAKVSVLKSDEIEINNLPNNGLVFSHNNRLCTLNNNLGSVSSVADLITLSGARGDFANVVEGSKTFVITENSGSQQSDWLEIKIESAPSAKEFSNLEALVYSLL